MMKDKDMVSYEGTRKRHIINKIKYKENIDRKC